MRQFNMEHAEVWLPADRKLLLADMMATTHMSLTRLNTRVKLQLLLQPLDWR